MKIHEALNAVMKAVPVVRKEDRNNAQNFSFRGIDAVLNAVGPVLRDFGVIVLPEVLEHSVEVVSVGRNGTPMRSVALLVQYTFVGPEGDTLTTAVPGEAFDAGDKAYSKAMSVALRTALLQTLALPTDDRDPDADAHEMTAPSQPAPQSAPKGKPKSEADKARELLAQKADRLDIPRAEVAKLYHADLGTKLAEEDDAAKILDFTERWEAGHK